MWLRPALIAMAVASGAALLFTPEASACGPLSASWSGIKGTVSTSFEPQATSCIKGDEKGCVAAGYYPNGIAARAGLETNSSGRWRPVPNSSPGPAQVTDSALDGVSCPAPTFCAAVGSALPVPGQYVRGIPVPLVALFDGNKWTYGTVKLSSGINSSAPAYTLLDVSCPRPNDCVAVGGDSAGDFSHNIVVTYDGHSWTPAFLPNPGNYPDLDGDLQAVSCASARWCVASGYYATDARDDSQGFAEIFDGQTWTVSKTPVLSGSNALFGVDCVGVGRCVAVGDQAGASEALVEQFSDNAWRVAPATPEPGQLTGVSCLAGDICAATGANDSRQPLVMTYVSGRWTKAVATAPVSGTVSLTGLSCARRTYCVAAGAAVPDGSLDTYLMRGSIPW
jgi:hypothetical protein